MNIRKVFMTGKLLGAIGVLAAIFSLAAIACSDDDDNGNTTDEAQAAFCGDLNNLQASVDAMAGLSGTSTVDDLKSAKDDVSSSWEDVQSSAADVKDAKIDTLETAYDDLSGAVDDLSGDESLTDAQATLQPNIDTVNSAWQEAYDSADCLASPTGETTPSATAGTPAEGAAGELDIKAMEFQYEGIPASQPGGLTTIKLENIGGEDHQAQLLRLNDGVTFDQFQSALQSDPSGASALALVSVTGGVNVIAPGTSQSVTNNLTEGSYVMLCFVSGSDGVPHLAKGMLSPFEVTAPPAEQPTAPTADAEIAEADFTFTGDTTLTAGEHTIHVTNNGPQPHEMTVVKLNEGVTVDDLKAMISAPEPTTAPGETPTNEPPPFTSAGGLGAIAPTTDGYAVMNLDAGNYALLCFVPDPNQGGAPHAALGMVVPLTVQ